jgi:POT family proton-dependent oligopeptide transporter
LRHTFSKYHSGFYYFSSAVSAALGQAFVGLSDDPLLVWLYGSVSIIAFIGGAVFWLLFRGWDKQELALNALPESSYIGTDLKEVYDEKSIQV